MDKDLIIDVSDSGVEIALLEDKQLVEFHQEKVDKHHLVGDIYLGIVKKVMPALNAAFVDVGHEKEGFLHYLDLGIKFNSIAKFTRNALNSNTDNNIKEPNLEKNGLISNVLKPGQIIMVQITKEAISTKGPRLSGEISFAGRYLVLVPFSNAISISKKVKESSERDRLKRLINSIKSPDTGIIIRTTAEGKSVAELDASLKDISNKWDSVKKKLPKTLPPAKLISEVDKSTAILRDFLSDEFNNIYVNNQDTYEELRQYIHSISPEKENIIKYYKNNAPIFENFGIANQIRSSFGKVVTVRSGIYIVIEQTEAMCVIDVNSGNKVKDSNNQDENLFSVNCEAAVAIARQLRLRDIGGIIVVDFIDMTSIEHRKLLYNKMEEEMRKDKARHTILPLSKFGLMQITRHRVKPIIEVNVSEVCPMCEGTGKVKSSLTVISDIEHDLRYLVQEQNEKQLTLTTHPFINAYITKGLLNSLRKQWAKTYGVKIKVEKADSFGLFEYQFSNKDKEIIKL
ncbi:MAG: Rne/Rng family ribonuclease [Bacteroidales bacterium]|jgi:ribonuclease G|nr:Rne/Rng family ribonuclease [Bacteroidales bacterium]